MKPIMRNYAALAGLLGWFAVMAQFYLIIVNRTESVTETVFRFFSFFTVLSNIAVSLCFTGFFMKGKWKTFFTSASTLTAVTVYILVVGIVYNLVLRSIWHPVGFQKWIDELLHSVIPLVMLLFWLVYVNKSSLQWKDAFSWMLFPFVYIGFIGLRGAISGFYPYPFVNVPELGYPKVLLNGSILLLVFMSLSLVLIGIAKWMVRNKSLIN